MMKKSKIPTHDTPSFLQSFTQEGSPQPGMMRLGFERFFIVRVEEMFQQIRLPVPPVRAQTTSIILLTSGEAVMRIGNEQSRISKNECHIVPTGQVFSFETPDVNTGYLLNFHHDFLVEKSIAPERLKTFEFLQVWGSPVIRLGETIAFFAHHLADRMLTDYLANGLKNAELLQSYLFALICELNEAYEARLPAAQGQAFALSVRFRELLQVHFKSLYLVADYAKLLHISPNHLNKAVKSATGKSPTQWIDEAILLEAKVLLGQTKLTVGEIAAEIGMADASYFSRFFKKMENCAPLEYRLRIEKS